MLKFRVLFLLKVMQTLNFLQARAASALALMAVGEIQKAVEGKSRIVIIEPTCALDETIGDEPTRESLRTWQTRISVTE